MLYDPETHTYYRKWMQAVPSVTQILQAAGLCGDPRFYRAGAADRGSRVHAILEEMDLYGDSLLEIDDEVRPYVDSYLAWRDKMPEIKMEVEKRIDGSWPIEYAGRADRIRGPMVIDIKAGAPAPWHRVQLFAYALALGLELAGALYLRPGRPATLRVVSRAEMEEAREKWAGACAKWVE